MRNLLPDCKSGRTVCQYFQENFAESKKCYIFAQYFGIDIQNTQQVKEV